MNFAPRLALALALALAGTASAPAQAPASVSGTWDIYWQTKKGPRKSGYMVFRQNGTGLDAELHGQGSVKAHGSVNGNRFTVRGTRMMVRYTIEGNWQGNHMEGAFRILSVNKPFTARRR